MNPQIKNEILALQEKTEIKESTLIQNKIDKAYLIESTIFFITICLTTIFLFTI